MSQAGQTHHLSAIAELKLCLCTQTLTASAPLYLPNSSQSLLNYTETSLYHNKENNEKHLSNQPPHPDNVTHQRIAISQLDIGT